MDYVKEFKNFCTLFDSGYLSRGLIMIESLKKHFPEATIYVFAFDDVCLKILTELALENVVVIPLSQFEDPELLSIKSTRSRGEYCWTSTPSTILYCLKNYSLPACTYIDADLQFFSSPLPIFEEMGNSSVLITPHWYTPKYDQTKASGIYCVQFVTVKNDTHGLTVLNWWRERCIEWCFARAEDGKFGDQKYLDHWPEQFEGVQVLQNRGGGMAPWNIQQYELDGSRWKQRQNEKTFVPIFYHFHSLKILDTEEGWLGDYLLSNNAVRHFYQPYLENLVKKDADLFKRFQLQPLRTKLKRSALSTLKKIFTRTLNIQPISRGPHAKNL